MSSVAPIHRLPAAEWIYPTPVKAAPCRILAETLGIPLRVAALLSRRGFTDALAASAFLEPRLAHLRDPMLLPGIPQAAARILMALDAGHRITLYGDYDVDGVTSQVLLARLLQAYGAHVRTFVPRRAEEGYGLTAAGAARCLAETEPQLMVVLDCGTASAKEVRWLMDRRVEVVILDHHLPPAEVPQCAALVNLKLHPEGEFTPYCTVGLVFKLAHALLKQRPLPGEDLKTYLDLVAIGTVADLVPLTGENRILVRRGLAQLAQTRWVGLAALCRAAGAKAPYQAVDCGFKIGPRINAAGRLGTAEDAVRLLLTDDSREAEPLARHLDRLNRERQAVEATVLAAAEEQVVAEFHPEHHAAIVVGAPEWHPGVIGIVASRLLQRYHRPVLVAGFDGQGAGKGSGRSIAGYSLVQALAACTHLLEKHGGHDLAAGFALPLDGFPPFRAAFLAHAGQALPLPQLRPRVRLDGEITLADVNLPLLAEYARLAPHGMGNAAPLFFARDVLPAAEPRVLQEKHLSLRLRQAGGREVRAIWFGGAAQPLPRPPWEVAFRLERNEWEGQVTPQLEIRALRSVR